MIGGGGRYDYLSAKITGTSIPAVGFYLNLDSIFAIMDESKQFHRNISDFSTYICAQSENLEMMTLQIAQELHNSGIKTVLSPDISSTETRWKFETGRHLDREFMANRSGRSDNNLGPFV